MAKRTAQTEEDNTLPEGWKMQYSTENNFSQTTGEVPKSLRVKAGLNGECSTRMEKDKRGMENQAEYSRGLEENKKLLKHRWSGGYTR